MRRNGGSRRDKEQKRPGNPGLELCGPVGPRRTRIKPPQPPTHVPLRPATAPRACSRGWSVPLRRGNKRKSRTPAVEITSTIHGPSTAGSGPGPSRACLWSGVFSAASEGAMRLWAARAGTSLGGRWVGRCDAACGCVAPSHFGDKVARWRYSDVSSSSSYRNCGRESSGFV